MGAEGKRPFRRRGGAKKNKNKKRQQADAVASANHVDSRTGDDHAGGYVSGFAPPQFREATETTLDQSLQSYLTKLANDLAELDPAGDAHANWRDGDDPPPPVLLARNALSELTPRATEIARDGTASRLVETLLRTAAHPPAAAALLSALLAPGSSRVGGLLAHHAASHVVEAVLGALPPVEQADVPTMDALNTLAEVCAGLTGDEIAEVMHSSSGSHALRAVVATLAGLPVDEPREAKLDDSVPGRIRTYIDRLAVKVPAAWLEAVCKMGRALLEGVGTRLKDFPWSPAPCTAVQAMLSGISVADRELALEVAQASVDGQVGELMQHACGSRFVERAVLCLGASFIEKEYKGRLKELARDGRANFCVQRILLGLRGRGAVMNAWDELEESVPHLLGFGKGRDGVVLALLRATEAEGDENARRRASRCVARCCGAIGGKAKLFAGILAMGSEEVWNLWRDRIAEMGRAGLGILGKPGDILTLPRSMPHPRLLGALVARCIMRYPGGPGQSVRDSMAARSDAELLALVGNPVGSRVVEQWVDADTTAARTKVAGKVLKAITNDSTAAHAILAVARNPYGAQVIVKCAEVLAPAQRKTVMEALASDFEGLKKHDCGQMVIRKCRVEQYIRRGDEWEHEETKKERRERMFADILEEGPAREDEYAAENTRKEKRKRKKEKKDGKEKDVACKRERKRNRAEGSVTGVDSIDKENKSSKTFDSLFVSEKDAAADNATEAPPDSPPGDEGKDNLQDVLSAITSAAKSTPSDPEPGRRKKKRKKKHVVEAKVLEAL